VPIPRQAARAVLLDPDNRVLLLKVVNQRTDAAWWVTPGGGLNPGESPADGLLRELREEIGLIEASVDRPLWENHRYFRQAGQVYSQDETFFLVRADPFAVDMAGIDEFERGTQVGHRWWSLGELRETGERVYPRGLAGLLAELLAKGPPPQPISITG
jgi:8-oxo-dGTP pyrophosphatase MutT (NUDIX family)